jgi:hypothetical protein
MSTFTYSAMNPSGQGVLGQLNAANRGEALQVLAKQALMPLTLTQSRVQGLGKVRVNPAAIAAACSLLADQLDTGVPLQKSLVRRPGIGFSARPSPPRRTTSEPEKACHPASIHIGNFNNAHTSSSTGSPRESFWRKLFHHQELSRPAHRCTTSGQPGSIP